MDTIYLNGEYLPRNEARVSVTTEGSYWPMASMK